MLSINNLHVRYNQTDILTDFSLEIKTGEIYSLIGPSGCGKSTLLKVLCGIQQNYVGTISYLGQAIEPKDLGIGYVPQHFGLLDWKTVHENIFLPFRLHKNKSLRPAEADDIVASLKIGDILHRYPSQLSGGQKQRVALARAFVSQPSLLLMDEPFSSLDTFTSMASQQLFLRLWQRYRVTTLFITHNIQEALVLGNRIILMSKAPGKILAEIENPLFDQENKEEERLLFAADILKRMALYF